MGVRPRATHATWGRTGQGRRAYHVQRRHDLNIQARYDDQVCLDESSVGGGNFTTPGQAPVGPMASASSVFSWMLVFTSEMFQATITPNYPANASASTAVTVTIMMGDEIVHQETVPVEVSSDE